MRTRILLVIGAAGAVLLPAVSAPPADAAGVAGQSGRISIGILHTLVVSPDGTLYGTGSNSSSQLCGAGPRPELSELACMPNENLRVTAASAGMNFTLIVATDGLPYGLGYNGSGQLTGTSFGTSAFQLMTGLPEGVAATTISAGSNHSLVLGSDGVVYGTGVNWYGQLTGTGDRTTLTPLSGLPGGVTATAIAASSHHSVVLGSDGIAYYTGENAGGGFEVNALTAFAGLPVGVKATAIAAGERHTLVVADDGKAYATGANDFNQLATNNGNDLAVLGAMDGLPVGVTAKAVAAGVAHSVVLGSDGRVYGVGRGQFGQLTGSEDRSTLTPMQSSAGAPIDGIAAAGYSTLKRDSDGIVYGVGNNTNGQLTTSGSDSVNAFVSLAGQVPTAISEPEFAGLARVGSTIHVSNGDWQAPPTSYGYQWRLNGNDIAGATSSSYSPVPSDVGKALSVRVRAFRSGFSPGNITVTPGVVAPGPALKYLGTPKPTVGGTARAGSTFRILNLRATGFKPTATSFKYQWLRNGVAIPGATARTYVLKAADRGKLVKVRITGRRAGYLNGTYTTPARRIAR